MADRLRDMSRLTVDGADIIPFDVVKNNVPGSLGAAIGGATGLTGLHELSLISEPTFATRAGAIGGVNALDLIDGRTIAAGALRYRRQEGATILPDFPDWVPEGRAVVEHYGSSKAATDAMLAHKGYVIFSQPGFVVDADTSIQGKIFFDDDASVTGAGGVTLTISGAIMAPPAQWIFQGDLVIVLTHVTGGGEDARYTEAGWFGIVPTLDDSLDYGPRFQKASTALGNSREGIIYLRQGIGNYPCSTAFTLGRGVWLKGEAIRMSVIRVMTQDFAITSIGILMRISGINFEWWGTGANKTTPTVIFNHEQGRIEDVRFMGCEKAVQLNANNCQVKRVRGVYGAALSDAASAYLVAMDNSNGEAEDIKSDTSASYGPTDLVKIGAGAAGNIAGNMVRNVSTVGPSRLVGIYAAAGNVGNTRLRDLYDGHATGTVDQAVNVAASGGFQVNGLYLDGVYCSATASALLRGSTQTAGQIRRVVLANCAAPGGGANGVILERISGSGTITDIAIEDSCNFRERTVPLAIDGSATNVRIGVAVVPSSQPGRYPIPSLASLAALAIPATISNIRVGGYAALGDGGLATWKRAASEPAHSAKRQDATGAWFELAEPVVAVEMLGAVAGLGLSAGQQTANVAAFTSAFDLVNVRGGGVARAMGQYYLLNARLNWKNGVVLEGAGTDEWSPIYPAVAKGWAGTSLVFTGTGVRDQSYAGITSMRYAGGWRENPDSPGSYYKLTSFRNADAVDGTASTPRTFSAAINVRGIQGGGIRNLRIVNADSNGGVAQHSDTSWSSLGADWDFGLALVDSQNFVIENFQAAGYWREAGISEIQTAISNSMGERNHMRGVLAQGRVGLMMRAMDRWAATGATTTTVSVRWSEEHYFAASGTFTGYNGSTTATYSYTSLSKVGNNLVFNGVTPDCSGVTEIRHLGRGVAGTIHKDMVTYPLCHVSGVSAATMGLADSKPLEVSGFPLRGPRFDNFKCHTKDPVVAHFHDVADATFIDPQLEGSGVTPHVIASPGSAEATYAAAPSGETRNIMLVGDTGTESMDLRLFLPRSGRSDALQLAPRDQLTADFIIRALRDGGHLNLRMRPNGEVRVQNADGSTNLLRFTTSGSMVSGGNHLPSADNVRSSGSSTARWSQMAAMKMLLADGIAEPATVAGNAQIYVDTADGDLKIKFGDGTVKTIVIDT